MHYLKLFVPVALLLAVCLIGLAIKIWGKKSGEFSGTCASQSPFLGDDSGSCGFCGKPSKNCKKQVNS